MNHRYPRRGLNPQRMSRRSILRVLSGTLGASVFGTPFVPAAETAPPILLTNARVFDGRSSTLRDGLQVLVANGRVTDLVATGQNVADAQTVDCSGGVVMPGLIDAHWHAMLAAIPQLVAMTADVPYVHLLAVQEAERTMMRGFTTVRDVGGPVFALKRVIDEGRFAGPRIYPSGAMISQTSGHGDFRLRGEVPRSPQSNLSAAEIAGVSAIADGVPEVLRRVREQLMLGASQIKILVGGGVSSLYDPIDSLQFTAAEIRAAVDAASDWGTYVCAHVYTSEGIQRAIDNGVKCIEHGQLADEETVRKMADSGVWWSIQPFLNDEDANPKSSAEQRQQQEEIAEGTVRALEWAKKFNVNLAIGTDILFDPRKTATEGKQLAKFARWFDSADVLRMLTSRNAELLGLSGPRNPYPGPLGVIEAGAHADLIVVNGNPLEDVDLIADPEKNFGLIMKAGRIYKGDLVN